jgi:hypothetical protein
MLDFTGFTAFELYRAREAEQADEARRTAWLRKLRDLDRHERAARKRPNPLKAARPQTARTLTGAHSPWI